MIVPGSVYVKGKKLDPKKTYGVIAPVFLALDGGDNFTIFKHGRRVTDALTTDMQAISARLAKTSQDAPPAGPATSHSMCWMRAYSLMAHGD